MVQVKNYYYFDSWNAKVQELYYLNFVTCRKTLGCEDFNLGLQNYLLRFQRRFCFFHILWQTKKKLGTIFKNALIQEIKLLRMSLINVTLLDNSAFFDVCVYDCFFHKNKILILNVFYLFQVSSALEWLN